MMHVRFHLKCMHAWLLHCGKRPLFLRGNQTSLSQKINYTTMHIAKHKNYNYNDNACMICMHVIRADACEHRPNTASIVAPTVIILIIMILIGVVVPCCVRKYRKKIKVRCNYDCMCFNTPIYSCFERHCLNRFSLIPVYYHYIYIYYNYSICNNYKP